MAFALNLLFSHQQVQSHGGNFWCMFVTILLRHSRGNHVGVIHCVNLEIKDMEDQDYPESVLAIDLSRRIHQTS